MARSKYDTWHTWLMTTRRAVIYARISRDRTGAGLGVATQTKDCQLLADHLGWTVVATHDDNDLSAYTGKPRPGYAALLADVRAGRVDAVLAWHEDRLHRSPRELEDYIDACEPRATQTRFVRAGELDLTTASGRMTARIRGAVARGEVEHMVERQRRAKQRSAESGTWKGGRRPFGYDDDGVTIREAEAQHVRSATRAALAGASMHSLARDWTAAGSTTTTGRDWTPTGVRAVLIRPRNGGLMEHRGQIVGDAQWPAIVDREQWEALRALLTDARRTTTTTPARRWLGSGLYACATCGETVVTQGSGRARRIYRCRPGHVSLVQADVDDYVRAVIAARLRQDDARDLLAHAGAQSDTAPLEDRAVTLRARLDGLAAVFAAGDIDAQQLTEGTRTLRADLEAVRSQISAASRGTALEGVADAPDPGAAFLTADIERQRAAVDLLVSITLQPGPRGRPAGWQPGQTYFRPERVQIEWRSPA